MGVRPPQFTPMLFLQNVTTTPFTKTSLVKAALSLIMVNPFPPSHQSRMIREETNDEFSDNDFRYFLDKN